MVVTCQPSFSNGWGGISIAKLVLPHLIGKAQPFHLPTFSTVYFLDWLEIP
jgi:hypothetical protein